MSEASNSSAGLRPPVFSGGAEVWTKYRQRQDLAKRVEVQVIIKSRHNQGNCGYCGSVHSKGKCPAYDKTCVKCGKINHFSKVCRSAESKKASMTVQKDKDEINVQSVQEEVESYQEFFIGVLVGGEKMHWFVNVDFHEVEQIRCKVNF